MADLNNNGIDDALEIEHTRKITNPDGSSQTDTVWRKNRPPEVMQNNMPQAGGWMPQSIKNIGESLQYVGGQMARPVQAAASWLGDKTAGLNPTDLYSIPRLATKAGEWVGTPSEVPTAVQPPVVNPVNAINSQPVSTRIFNPADINIPVNPFTPTLNRAVSSIQPAGGIPGIMAEQATQAQVAPVVPSAMTQNQPSAWDKFNEENRLARVRMGIGGIGNAKTLDEAKFMLSKQYGETRDTAQKSAIAGQLGQITAQQAQSEKLAATGASNAQELALQEAKNKGLLGGATAKSEQELAKQRLINQGKIDVENIKRLGVGNWKNFEVQGQVIPNTYINEQGKVQHIPVSELDSATNDLLSGGAAPVAKLSPQDDAALAWAKTNPNDPRAKAILAKLQKG
jgi:hypothetical protein